MARVLCMVHRPGSQGVPAWASRVGGGAWQTWFPGDPQPLGKWSHVLVLGGWQNPDQQGRWEWMREEIAFLRRWAQAGRPLLGICLGAQLLAAALGGATHRLPEPEVGWVPMRLDPAAQGDPLLGHSPAQLPALQWHSYGFELPPGATPLAWGPAGLQGFRCGQAWGWQCHPEADGAKVEQWIAAALAGDSPHERRLARAHAAELRAGLQHMPAWQQWGAELFDAWLRVEPR